jgi:hypothetical protein
MGCNAVILVDVYQVLMAVTMKGYCLLGGDSVYIYRYFQVLVTATVRVTAVWDVLSFKQTTRFPSQKMVLLMLTSERILCLKLLNVN